MRKDKNGQASLVISFVSIYSLDIHITESNMYCFSIVHLFVYFPDDRY